MQEAKYTLAHMECRRARRSNLWNAFYVTALLLHWYDPCVWAAVFLVRRDEQMACDECAVDRCSAADKNAYITRDFEHCTAGKTCAIYCVCKL